MIGLVVITDGRKELFARTFETFNEKILGAWFGQMICVDDSGDASYGEWLDDTLGNVVHHPERSGLAASIRTAWATLDLDTLDYILHLEDDFEFVRPLKLDQWLRPFALEPRLAQVCLQRAPQTMEEIAGGTLPRSLNGIQRDGWVEQHAGFSLQPNIYPTWVAELGWPEHGGETEFNARLFDTYPQALLGYLGTLDEAPHYEHVGYGRRSAAWQL